MRYNLKLYLFKTTEHIHELIKLPFLTQYARNNMKH